MEQQTSAATPVQEGLFVKPQGDEPPRLIGGYCPDCGQYFFPKPVLCRSCLKAVNEADLGSEGRLYSFTVVRTKPPFGLPKPYGLGYVDLTQSGLRIFTLIDPLALDRLRLDQPVRLRLGVLGDDGRGQALVRPYFTPAETDRS